VSAIQQIGWGILATGHIAAVFARDLALLDEARLVAVGSRSADRAEAFAAEHGATRAYGSYADLAADPEVEAVYVASIHNDHFESARLCLEAGKAVLVEKPLTTSPTDTAALIDLARDRRLFLMEAMWTRAHPLIRRLAEIAAAGEIGMIRHVAADFGFAFRGPETHRLLDPDQAGGAILDAGVYPAHAVNLFLGEPAELSGYGHRARTGVDTHAAAMLHYPATDRGGPATAAMLCSIESPLPSRLAVYGTGGRIMIDDFYLRAERASVFRGDDEPEVLEWSFPSQGYTYEIAEAMRCLRAGELESPMIPWEDTLAVARTLQAWQDAVARTPGTGEG
jgi:predicted dehydrogenase